MQKKKKKKSIFSIQKFSQNIPNFDMLERVWQSLFKVYNQTIRQMGDNDFFSVEHTGVRVRQIAGTLERVVKYKIRCGGLPKGLGLLGVKRRRRQLFFFSSFFR